MPPADEYVDPAVIVARRGSAYAQSTLAGLEFTSRSTGTMPGPESLLLVPGAAPVAWALYSFADNLAEDTPLLLTVELTPALPSCLYIAIADYGTESWHWLAVDGPAAGINLSFPAEVQPVSPGGRINVLVLVETEENASIKSLTLHRNVVAPTPVNLATNADDPRPDMISLSWEDPAVTWPGLGYDAVRIERRTNIIEGWDVLVDVPAGLTEYSDIWSTENTIPYDVDVSYRIRTVAGDTAGLPCTPVTGLRRLQDVTQFAAGDGDYPDRVHITWDPVPGAESYELESRYVSPGVTWTPVTSGLITEYDYYWDEFPEYPMGFGEYYGCYVRVRACWQGLTTEWNYDDGYRTLPMVHNIQATEGVYPDKVVITWDPVPGATGYVIWYDHHLGGIPERPWVMEFVDGQETCSFEHTMETPGLPELYYNHVYSYGVSGQYDGAYDNGYKGYEVDGFRVLQPPAGFTASDDEFSDRIRLSWEPANGATAYLVYRDGMDTADLVATLGDVTTWDDLGITDTGLHHYWIRSTWEEHTSDFSPAETGSVSLFDIFSTGLPNHVDAALIDGNPAVIYTTWTEDTRSYHYAGSSTGQPAGPGDWSSHLLITTEKTWSNFGLGEVGGLPAIAYGLQDTDKAYYAFADTATPSQTSDWHTTVIKEEIAYGYEFLIEEINGLPAIAFTDLLDINYAYASVAQPLDNSDWHLTAVELDGYQSIDLQVRDDKPVILSSMPNNLYIANSATPETNSDWLTSKLLDHDVSYSSLCFIAGLPVVSLVDWNFGYLHYYTASVPDPSTSEDWTCHYITTDGLASDENQMVVIDGKPLIVFRWGEWEAPKGSALKIAMANTANPQRSEDWDQRVIVSSPEDYYDYGRLKVLVKNDRPLIFFNHEDTSDLVYATLRD